MGHQHTYKQISHHRHHRQMVEHNPKEREGLLPYDNMHLKIMSPWKLKCKEKIPFMLIAGEEDQKAGAVSFRYRSGEQKNGIAIEEAINVIVETIAKRIQV